MGNFNGVISNSPPLGVMANVPLSLSRRARTSTRACYSVLIARRSTSSTQLHVLSARYICNIVLNSGQAFRLSAHSTPRSSTPPRSGTAFFAENGEHSLHPLARAVGDAFVAVGRATDAEPDEFTPEERLKYFGSEFAANLNFTNARVRADRARRDLGWVPKYTTEDMLKNAREEVEDLVKKQVAAA